MPSPDATAQALSIAGNDERSLPDARRPLARRAEVINTPISMLAIRRKLMRDGARFLHRYVALASWTKNAIDASRG
jgi:hypothetical protein